MHDNVDGLIAHNQSRSLSIPFQFISVKCALVQKLRGGVTGSRIITVAFMSGIPSMPMLPSVHGQPDQIAHGYSFLKANAT